MSEERRRSTAELTHIRKMRAAGRLAATVLDAVNEKIKAGVTTDELNTFCHDLIISRGATPAPLNFNVRTGMYDTKRGFPKSICTSVNHIAGHGIPSDQVLHDGDVIKVDVSVKLDGVFGDSCRTYFVGEPTEKAKNITIAAYNAMMAGINAVKPGRTVGDIGAATAKSLESTSYFAVEDSTGHGIGTEFHMEPDVFPYRNKNSTEVLKPGMIFTIEPSIIEGGYPLVRFNREIAIEPGMLSAQFEHTVLVTDNGCEILTASPKKIYLPDSIKHKVIKCNVEGQSP